MQRHSRKLPWQAVHRQLAADDGYHRVVQPQPQADAVVFDHDFQAVAPVDLNLEAK